GHSWVYWPAVYGGDVETNHGHLLSRPLCGASGRGSFRHPAGTHGATAPAIRSPTEYTGSMNRDTGRAAARGAGRRTPHRAADALPPVIRALLDPAAYPPPRPAAVELRQTHISYVLLAGERVYKVKKPVALGFLDYSTPARRAYYCRREVALNRRFAPDVYLGVVAIVARAGAVRVGGRGRVLERAVLMRRLPGEGMLTHLLTTGVATPALLAQIARRVAAFHADAASGPRVARYGRPGAVRHTVL